MEDTLQVNGVTARRTVRDLAPVPREAREAYEQATAKLTFTKEFFGHQQAVIADTRNTMGERFMACVRWRAWGQNCLYCVTDTGSDAWQGDFADWLHVDKRRISSLYEHYIERGYLRLEGKRVYPVLNPCLPGGTNSTRPNRHLKRAAFDQWWEVQAPEDFSEYSVLKARLKELEKVRLAAVKTYTKVRVALDKKSACLPTNAAPSLYETKKTVDVNTVRPYVEEEKSFEAIEDGRTVSLPSPPPEIVGEERPESQDVGTGQKELIPLIVEELRHIGEVFPKWSRIDNPQAAAQSIAEACEFNKEAVVAVFQSFAATVRESDKNIKSAVGLLISRARRFQQGRSATAGAII